MIDDRRITNDEWRSAAGDEEFNGRLNKINCLN